MPKKSWKRDALAELISAAPPKVLSDLILNIASQSSDVRRECFDFLKSRVSVSKRLEEKSEGEIVLALWSDLELDLDDMDRYGGSD